MSNLLLERQGHVAIVTLNDPSRRNALSLALAQSLSSTVTSLSSDASVGALVITGAPPAFSAGAVLDDLDGADEERLKGIYEGFLAVARFPRPTLAAVNGAAVGAGLNLALSCDVRIVGRGARFESRFADLALHPGGGHTWMLGRLLGPQGAAAVVLGGEVLDGEGAVRHGLAWRCVDDRDVVAEAVRLASHAAAMPSGFLSRLTYSVRSMGDVNSRDEAVAIELEQQLWSIGQPEFRQRLRALKKRISGTGT